MSLKIGIFSIILATISHSLASANECQQISSFQTCLNNKSIEVDIADDLTCQVRETFTSQKFRDDYTLTPGIGWHKFHNQAKTWNDARKVCESEEAHLAIINSKAEEEVLASLLNNGKKFITGTPHKDFVALGGHNFYGLNDWVTIFGEALSSTGYVNWSKNCPGGKPEPNNSGGNEHCLSLASNNCQQGLNDFPCDVKYAFVCEKSDICS